MQNRFLSHEDEFLSGKRLTSATNSANRLSDHSPYRNRFLDYPGFAVATSLTTSLVLPALAVRPFQQPIKQKMYPLLTPKENNSVIQKNTALHPNKSGVDPAKIIDLLGKYYVDISAIETQIKSFNSQNPNNLIDLSNHIINGIFVEAVHQFQQKCYISPNQHDGIAGISTLNSLGILPISSFNNLGINTKAVQRLKKHNIKTKINAIDVDYSNWFDFMVNPAFMGWTSTNGIHYELAVRMREVEGILMSKPPYAGLTPAQLGAAIDLTEQFKGARPDGHKGADSTGYHTYGLSIDINYLGNPFIGDPDKFSKKDNFWAIIKKVGESMKSAVQWEACGKAPLDINKYFHCLAESLKDTPKIYDALFNLNAGFKAHLSKTPADVSKLQGDDNYFNGRNPGNGFLALHYELVHALRENLCLAWGAVDLGNRASGDMMHFDMRIIPPYDRLTYEGPYWPKGIHPCQIRNNWKTISSP